MKKVKQSVLDVVNNPKSRTRIGLSVDTGENNIAIAIRRNVPDGILTKMRYVEAISKESGVPVDEILEDVKEKIA